MACALRHYSQRALTRAVWPRLGSQISDCDKSCGAREDEVSLGELGLWLDTEGEALPDRPHHNWEIPKSLAEKILDLKVISLGGECSHDLVAQDAHARLVVQNGEQANMAFC